MAFPTIPTVAGNAILTTGQATAATTHTFPSLTTLAPAAGDLLIAVIVTYRGGSADAEFSSWGGGFTEFCDRASNVDGVQAIGAAYKFATGSETGTFTVTTVSSTRSAMILMQIPGAHASTPPEAGARATGTTTAANPASFNPSGWDAEDTLWIAVAANGETSLTGSFTGITAAPTNYTNYFETGIHGGDVIGAIEGAVAFRALNASAEDVGAFTLDTGAAASSALTIAIRPAAVLGVITQTDNTGITDTGVSVLSTKSRTVTDSTGLTDGPLLKRRTLVPTDSAGLTDLADVVPSGGATEHTVTQTDNAGLTDARLLTQSVVVTDSAGLTDTSTVQAAKLVTVTDSAGLTDTGLSLDIGEVLTDSVGLTDAAPLARSLVVTDSAGLTDTATVQAVKLVVQTDNTGLTDATVIQRSLGFTDTTGLTDTPASALSKTITDSAGLTDTSAISSGKLLDFTDSAGLTDTQAFSQTKVHTDSAGLTDAAALTIAKVFTDSAGLTDAASAGLQKEIAATDSVGLTDSRSFARTLGVEDLVGLTDATSFSSSYGLTDSAGLSDAATVLLQIPLVYGTGGAGNRAAASGRSGQQLVGSGVSGRG